MPSALSEKQNEYARAVIRELVNERKMSQEKVGELIGIDQSAVSAIAKAHSTRGTTVDVLVAAAKLAGRSEAEIARVFGLNIEPQLGEADPPTPIALASAIRRGAYLKATVLQARIRARDADAPLTEEDWSDYLDGLDRENRRIERTVIERARSAALSIVKSSADEAQPGNFEQGLRKAMDRFKENLPKTQKDKLSPGGQAKRR
jgi:transcriptional regulator with XRE-family HTH domain